MAAAAEFDGFVGAHSRGLLQSAWLLTGDWAAAEDLVQTALLRLWQRWDVIGLDAPLAYVRRVLINGYLTGRRRRWRGEVPFAEPPERPASTPGGDTDLRAALVSALALLPARQRAAVVLRYFQDLSEAQTAQALNCSVGNVKSQTSRALTKLRSMPDVRALLEEVRHG